MVIVGMLFGGAVKCKYNSYMYYMCVSLYVLVLHVSTLRAQNNQSQIPLTCDLTWFYSEWDLDKIPVWISEAQQTVSKEAEIKYCICFFPSECYSSIIMQGSLCSCVVGVCSVTMSSSLLALFIIWTSQRGTAWHCSLCNYSLCCLGNISSILLSLWLSTWAYTAQWGPLWLVWWKWGDHWLKDKWMRRRDWEWAGSDWQSGKCHMGRKVNTSNVGKNLTCRLLAAWYSGAVPLRACKHTYSILYILSYNKPFLQLPSEYKVWKLLLDIFCLQHLSQCVYLCACTIEYNDI